jgi:LysR family transcriptional regulator, transcriptional activator of nhaA
MNFKHLHYFWVVAKAGGVMRAGEQLHTTPQTLSAQIKLLEDRLGKQLFRKNGRKLELTDDGRVALSYADEIFNLGAEMESALQRTTGREHVLDFRIGVADSVPKALAYQLLEPALDVPEQVRMVCHEGKFTDLLAQLALHRLDMVLADEPLSRRVSVKAFNHSLGSSGMSFFCAPTLQRELKGKFPHCLNGAPMLVQGAASPIRAQFDSWLERHHLHPRVVGEFDDGALMKAFGQRGRGVFMGPTAIRPQIEAQYGVKLIGQSNELLEEFFAVSVERRVTHPCVVAIQESARRKLSVAS